MFVRLCTQEGEMWGSAGGLLLAGRRARTVSPSLPKGFYVNKGLLWSPGRLPPSRGRAKELTWTYL